MTEDPTELTSRVKTQGTMLCFPLGETLEVALARVGFIPEQPVVVRFSNERLEIRPLNTPEMIQEKLKSDARDLRGFRERIRGYLRELPRVSDEELEAGESLEGELLGMLECLIGDDLDPAIRKLESVDELGPAPTRGSSAPEEEDDR
jgi:hypothetical protein